MKPTFSIGSPARVVTMTGRIWASRARSVIAADRWAERTDTNVAQARIIVPAAVASEEIVTQSAMSPTLSTPILTRSGGDPPVYVTGDLHQNGSQRQSASAAATAPT